MYFECNLIDLIILDRLKINKDGIKTLSLNNFIINSKWKKRSTLRQRAQGNTLLQFKLMSLNITAFIEYVERTAHEASLENTTAAITTKSFEIAASLPYT